MPELPEVEVVKKSLQTKIVNLIIKKVNINDSNLRYKVKKEKFSKLLGKRINSVKRRSKFLIFEFENNFFMLVHLGMTGKFFFINKEKKKFKTSFYYDFNNEKDKKYDRVIFHFKGNQRLIYNDVRKFGFFKLYNKNDYFKNLHLRNLGPEPLSKTWNIDYFRQYIHGRNRSIKSILMDQKFVSGLGNIYVNEVLFKSNINPYRKVDKLKNFEIDKIIKNTKKILIKSINVGGSSIKDFSSDDGKKGSFQQYFKVYGRNGKICSNTDCNTTIMRSKISNRSTFICKSCQK